MTAVRMYLEVALSMLFMLVSACPQRTAIWIEAGSEASHLTFRIADRRGGDRAVSVGVLVVTSCSAEDDNRASAVWIIEPTEGTQHLQRVVYGSAPNGFVSSLGPKPLTPGCYRAAISGTGRSVFVVHEDGTVKEDITSAS